MSSAFDETDFIDRDFQSAQQGSQGQAGAGGIQGKPPSREELENRVADTQQRLAELKRAQEALERERAALEEARRRRVELQSGREEMVQNLVRGIGLLEEAEFSARRDAEQMAQTLVDFREALAKVQGIQENTWTEENWPTELTRALTVLENARMEWNSARLKIGVLSGTNNPGVPPGGSQPGSSPLTTLLKTHSLAELCKLGLALTWPIAAVGLIAVILFFVVMIRR